MLNYEISGFSDEISSNIIEQFEHLNKLGIKYFEPRGINGVNISELTDSQCDKLIESMEKYGIRASSIGSPIGKISINDDFEAHKKVLLHTISTAKKLNTKYIRIFSFYIPDGDNPAIYRDEVIKRMKAMCEIAKENDIILLHENEKGIYGDNAERCLDILETVNSKNLRGIFDPANFVQCKQKTYPEAFNILEKYIDYIHIKDAIWESGAVVPSGMGDGHLYSILLNLAKKNYTGFLSIEPHLGSFDGVSALETDDKMTKLSASNADKFTLAYESLMKIIERIESNERCKSRNNRNW